jgi:hypothetical protein
MTFYHHIPVRDPIPFLSAVIEALHGDAYVSLEGDLSRLDLSDIENIRTEPTDALPRQTLDPKLGFVIIPLEADTKDAIIQNILPRIGIRTRVVHVQITKRGKQVFAAYDNFDPDCVWLRPIVSGELIDQLVREKVIRSYRVTAFAWLQHAVQALALPCRDQFDLLPPGCCRTDELALDFDDWYRVVTSSNIELLAPEEKAALAALDHQVDRMSDSNNEALWTDDALCYDPAWEEVRRLARDVLCIFGWPAAKPPMITWFEPE